MTSGRPRSAGRKVLREAVVLLLAATAAAGALWLAFRIGSYQERVVLCVVGGLAIAVCWRLVVAISPPPQGLPAPLDRQAPDDGLIELTSLEHRLSWGSVDADRFRDRVHPLLVDLALERLRSRHGVEPATRPEDARRILGESLWQMVTGPPPSRCPSRPELSRLVEDMERI